MSALEAYIFLNYLGQFLKSWWWVFPIFILWKPLLFLYLWWRIDHFLSQQRWVLLEIKLPKEILKPIRAMEVVLTAIHSPLTQPPDFWEKWIDGQVQLSIALEIASINGEPHFYVRTPTPYRDQIESSLYSQYSEIEIKEVEDYTKFVPESIPNKDWDMFGADYENKKDDHLPIKTYMQFETEKEALEEKRIDPIAGLLEAMAKIKEGEQLWVQFIIEPLNDADSIKILWGIEVKPGSFSVWKAKGEALRDTLARREENATKQRPIIQDAADILLFGKVPGEEEKKQEVFPPEMKLTPGEREILAALEMKMSKVSYITSARFIYLGKRDVWFKPNFRLAFSFFNQYATNNLGLLYPMGSGKTLTKIAKSVFFPPLNWQFIRSRRLYLRCRRLLRNYRRRLSPFFPRKGGTFVLNVEEIASLFHFPGEIVAPAPGVSRIASKKGGVPPELPIE